jgi:hypothetical protein
MSEYADDGRHHIARPKDGLWIYYTLCSLLDKAPICTFVSLRYSVAFFYLSHTCNNHKLNRSLKITIKCNFFFPN